MFDAMPTCVTLLRRWGLPVVGADPSTHLAVPRDRGLARADPRPRSAVVFHREEREITGVATLDAVVALRHAGSCLPRLGFVAAVDATLNRGLVDRSRLGEAAGPAVDASWLTAVVDARSESPAETFARVPLVERGFRVASQVDFERIGRVDLVVADAVVVETDGFAFHSSREAFEADRSRDRALRLLGFSVLRYTASQVFRDPVRVARDVERLVGPPDRPLGR